METTFLLGKPQSYNLTKEEWQALKNLKEGRSIIIKIQNKGFCVVVWDRKDYLAEGYKQFNNESTYVKVKYSKNKTVSDLIEKMYEQEKDDFRKGIEILFI